MKTIRVFLVLVCCALPISLAQANLPWGFFAHRLINRMAVFRLPPEMFAFYKRNIDFLTAHAVDPDKRRYLINDEAPRHFMDLDDFPELVNEPRLMSWKEALECYSLDTLQARGISPWNIELVSRRLTRAFVDRDSARILRYSAYLGHYLADACVPLHTSSNYNGQKTNQKGIHGFWETRLPGMFSEEYDWLSAKAGYVHDPLQSAWGIIRESHVALDSVLSFEARLNAETPIERKFEAKRKGGQLMADYSNAYAAKYHRRLNGMVERRLQRAVDAVGNYWYSAWMDAGQPVLDNWPDPVPEGDTLNVFKQKTIVRQE